MFYQVLAVQYAIKTDFESSLYDVITANTNPNNLRAKRKKNNK